MNISAHAVVTTGNSETRQPMSQGFSPHCLLPCAHTRQITLWLQQPPAAAVSKSHLKKVTPKNQLAQPSCRTQAITLQHAAACNPHKQSRDRMRSHRQYGEGMEQVYGVKPAHWQCSMPWANWPLVATHRKASAHYSPATLYTSRNSKICNLLHPKAGFMPKTNTTLTCPGCRVVKSCVYHATSL
jgi:hypothetical protein